MRLRLPASVPVGFTCVSLVLKYPSQGYIVGKSLCNVNKQIAYFLILGRALIIQYRCIERNAVRVDEFPFKPYMENSRYTEKNGVTCFCLVNSPV